MEAVEGVAVNLDAELMGDGGQVEQGVGGAGDGGVDQDGVLEAVHGDNVAGAHVLHGGQLHGQFSGVPGIVNEVGAGGGEQGGAGQGKA